MNDNRIEVLEKSDECFPEFLAALPGGPARLYCIGDLSLLKRPAVAVVGARKCSEYGRRTAIRLGKALSAYGIVTVSGMAYGIDGAAHAGALSQGGPSIAVLGTGPDICYPRENVNVYRQLCRGGLVVSEYAPGTAGKPWHFPARNRIISALSKVIVVVEAEKSSGALITAVNGAEQGKEVMAVPGNIDSVFSEGANALIRDGAAIVTCMEDVVRAAGVEPTLWAAARGTPFAQGPSAIAGNFDTQEAAARGTLSAQGPSAIAGNFAAQEAAARGAESPNGPASRQRPAGARKSAALPAGLSAREALIYETVRRQGEASMEKLCAESGLTPLEAGAAVAVMEMKGMLTYAAGKIFIANF